jgi:hypothetical protein
MILHLLHCSKLDFLRSSCLLTFLSSPSTGFEMHKIDTQNEDGLQLIGIGLPRTGTSSIQAALAILAIGPVHHMTVRELADLCHAIPAANAPVYAIPG